MKQFSFVKCYFKQLTALIISVVLIFTTINVVFAVGATNTKQGRITFFDDVSADFDEVIETIINGINNHEEKIDIQKYNVARSDMNDVILAAYTRHPEVFNFCINESRYGSMNDVVVYLKPGYYMEKSEADKITAEMNVEVNRILSLIKPEMSDYAKALTIHDELVMSCKYADDVSDEEVSYAKTIFLNHEGNCEGFSNAYMYLLSLIGIDCEKILSLEMCHSWIKAKIDGEYFNIDVAWDDPVPDRSGYVSHKYFMLSDYAFQNKKTIEKHYCYDSLFRSINTKYDDDETENIDTRICYIDGKYYAIINKASHKFERHLVTLNPNDGTVSDVMSLDYRWTTKTGYWLGGFMSLDYVSNMLVFNSPDNINIYVPNTKKTYDIAKNQYDKHFFGMFLRGRLVYADLNTNPNNAGEIRYITEIKDLPVDTTAPTTKQTPTTAPVTTVPKVTTAPITTAPVTTVPKVTTAPITTAPVTTVPKVTTAPITTAPITTVPKVTTAPITTVPKATTAPITNPAALKGDADLDGFVKISDVTCIQRHCADMRLITDPQALINADMDGNGKVDILDATALQRWLAS